MMTEEAEAVRDAPRTPSPHVIRAALRTAALIDEDGSRRRVAEEAYLQDPSGGLFRFADLALGEELLISLGLVHEIDGVLYPSTELADLTESEPSEAQQTLLGAALVQSAPDWLTDGGPLFSDIPGDDARSLEDVIPDPERREAFLIAIAGAASSANAELGLRGEEFIVGVARDELIALGRPDLARRVRRVSEFADTLGYDVTAPLVEGGTRRLEVKTTGRELGDECTIYISRNEVEVGLRDKGWALVICHEQEGEIDLLGWCRGATLAPYLPADSAASHWTSTRIIVPRHVLLSSIPPAL